MREKGSDEQVLTLDLLTQCMHYIPQFLDKTGGSTNVLEPAAMGRLGFGAFALGWVGVCDKRQNIGEPARATGDSQSQPRCQRHISHSHRVAQRSSSLSRLRWALSNQFHQSILINCSLMIVSTRHSSTLP